MNRKEAAEQLNFIISSPKSMPIFLTGKCYEAINCAINELEKCCANCIHHHINSDGEFLCIMNSVIIRDDILESHFCAEHERMDEFENEPF